MAQKLFPEQKILKELRFITDIGSDEGYVLGFTALGGSVRLRPFPRAYVLVRHQNQDDFAAGKPLGPVVRKGCIDNTIHDIVEGLGENEYFLRGEPFEDLPNYGFAYMIYSRY